MATYRPIASGASVPGASVPVAAPVLEARERFRHRRESSVWHIITVVLLIVAIAIGVISLIFAANADSKNKQILDLLQPPPAPAPAAQLLGAAE